MSLFTAAYIRRHPFSRSYGVILPSSLTMLLPPALGFSPHPPVSVYGTGTIQSIAAFLGTTSGNFTTFFRSLGIIGLLYGFAYTTPSLPRPVFPFLALPFIIRPYSSVISQYRNLHLLSIDYGSLPRLRSRLTRGRSALPRKPWIFGLKDSHLHLATHSGILSSINSTPPYGNASSLIQCSSTNGIHHS